MVNTYTTKRPVKKGNWQTPLEFPYKKWENREVLFGFEPLSGTHSSVNLGEVVLQILQNH
ncbi:uncharacterized protein N7506_008211 [Penicillium brevicompactum]|uniref:uncharacterized protein n=1 Tax=Penicillium brevicompactum TaxID=5074 RepID=UPI002541922A|nr:uncharacterized protein N7506_008211 [Penicillium brevicompactum]KAJ5334428.1 hypothetical protein N7506_008211 [Penicillium brevicompactum]